MLVMMESTTTTMVLLTHLIMVVFLLMIRMKSKSVVMESIMIAMDGQIMPIPTVKMLTMNSDLEIHSATMVLMMMPTD